MLGFEDGSIKIRIKEMQCFNKVIKISNLFFFFFNCDAMVHILMISIVRRRPDRSIYNDEYKTLESMVVIEEIWFVCFLYSFE